MDRASNILKKLVLTAIQTADLQHRRLVELSAKDFPVEHSALFIDALIKFNKETMKILREKLTLFEQLSQKEDYDNLHNYVIQYLQLLWHLNYIAHIVERSDRTYVGESTVILLSEFTKNFKTSKFFVIPTYEYNYSYQPLKRFLLLVSRMLPDSREKLKELPDNLAVLSFPDIYKDNVIANSELAHEIGHFIDELGGVTTKILKKVKVDKTKLREEINKDLDTEKLPYLLVEKIKAERIKQINYNIKRWVQELLSDLIAIRLCGPAFVFALSELLLTKQIADDANIDYPPATLRLRILLEEMKSINYIDKLSNENKDIVKDLISEIDEHIKSVPQKTGEPLVNEAIESVLDLIKQESNTATNGFQYEPDRFGNEVFELLEKLKQYVPPCEIKRGKPANPISILNAGMIFRLTWKNYPPPITITSQENESEVVNIINLLVSKSIELSMIQDKMQEYKE